MAISLNINGKSHNVNSDPDPATSPSNPRFGVREARAVKLEPWSSVPGPRSRAVIQTVIQNRALADKC